MHRCLSGRVEKHFANVILATRGNWAVMGTCPRAAICRSSGVEGLADSSDAAICSC